MATYKHPCLYCGELISKDSNVCPLCSKVNPLGPLRCQKCGTPIEKNWKICSNCGLSLEIPCPKCGEKTFFGDYCDKCGERLTVICPDSKCKTEQPPLGEKCVKCGKSLK